ncbi:caveolin-2 [Erpetoichthys calabaricus]|uniref:Caveolin n=1 Tax=Erpetoichthys calabaricus TaxID=27687 RepID=A0A8C4X9L0_ERPCA|nr:caveolin-2 [Erpetoichthys calabaricus]
MLHDDLLVECKIDEGEIPRTAAPAPLPAEPPPKIDVRDPHGINQHLKVDFNDVLAEPSSFHSFDKVWTWSDILFEASKLWCYRIISLLCAVPVSIITGFLFAILGCLHIWCVIPCVKLCTISMPPIRTLWNSILEIIVVPVCVSIGRCCSSIYMTVSKQ